MDELEKLAYVEITKLAFFDELEKIGYDREVVEELLKEAGLVSGIKSLVTKAPKAMPKMSPAQMAAMKAQWRAGAGRAGQAMQKVRAPSAATSAMQGGGGVLKGFGM